jgi:hypothetical protein
LKRVEAKEIFQTRYKPKERERKNMNSQNTAQNTVVESNSGRVIQYARRVALSAPGKLLLAVAVLISLVSIPLLTRAQESNEKRTLTGNWLVTATRLTPLPGQAPTFLGLNTYFEDGNLLVENNTGNINSTARGNWQRIGYQQFTQSFIFFRFDAARNYLGTGRVRSTITLSEDGSEFQSDIVSQIYDASGNLLSTAGLSGVAHRL